MLPAALSATLIVGTTVGITDIVIAALITAGVLVAFGWLPNV